MPESQSLVYMNDTQNDVEYNNDEDMGTFFDDVHNKVRLCKPYEDVEWHQNPACGHLLQR